MSACTQSRPSPSPNPNPNPNPSPNRSPGAGPGLVPGPGISLGPGKAHKFGDDVNTDYIISGKYKFKTLDMKELARHIMEDLDPGFYDRLSPGDFVVAGSNFGCGSSREQAPLVVKHAGIPAVLAKSFARIFYRNAINTGLAVIECDTDRVSQGDELVVDLAGGAVRNITTGAVIPISPIPRVMLRILADGGLAEHFKKHGGFAL